ncbi:MAG: succinylglutamate desuccinylase/aspartoacylase family protein [Bacteroidota bacterium]
MKRIIIVFLVLSSVVINAQDKKVFSIGSIQANPGEKVTGKLIVEEGIDKGSFIPITVIYGEKPGPVLTLNAGIHGTEYVPVITLQLIMHKIKPEDLSGILIMVHVANIPSFQGRGVYNNPIDFKNLNRVYPGKADGTFSERLAFTLTNEIITKSDYYIDLHGGEFNESLLNFLYFYYGCPDADVCRKSRMMAHAMGNRYLIPYDFNSIPDSLPSQYSEYEAMRQGVPAIVVEFGDRGEVDPSILDFAEKGIMNVMKTLGMLEGNTFVVDNPIYLLDEESIKSDNNGIFYSLFEKGHYVTKGSLLGYTTDYWGNRIEQFTAPYSGIIVSIYLSPVVNKGESVIHLAKVSDQFIE